MNVCGALVYVRACTSHVRFRFDKAKTEAEIRDFRFDDLRHFAATRMADGGADASTLAEIFGIRCQK